jgi:pimeloyl-ACP methyl ester carboxylesterase
VDEAGLNYRVAGHGPPLLLVHGFGISFNIWRRLRPFLAPHFMLVMIELPGIGSTPMPPDGQDYLKTAVEGIKQVRRSLGIATWMVLGYSTGSRIAEAYVEAEAGQVRRATFLCPLTMDAHKLRALRLGLSLDGWLPAFGTWGLSGWRLKLLISWLGFNLRRDPMLDEWFVEIAAVPVRVLKETIRAVARAAGGPFSVPVPYAMIWGNRDLVPLRPRELGPHDYLVHGRHAAPLESAEEVARVIILWAAKNETTNERDTSNSPPVSFRGGFG